MAARGNSRTIPAESTNGQELRTLFQLSAVGMAVADPQTGRFRRVNRKLAEITGFSQEELLGMTFTDITHPDDRREDLTLVDPVRRGEVDSWRIEKRCLRRDGQVIWVRVTGTAVRDGQGRVRETMAVIEDITGSRNASRALDRYQDRLEQVLAASRDSYWDWDARRPLVYLFGGRGAVLGAGHEQLDLEHLAALVHPEDRRRARQGVAVIRGQAAVRDTVEMELRVWRAGGYAWVAVRGTVVERDERGAALRACGSVTDISDRVEAAQHLAEANRRLELRVKERTAELETVVQELTREVGRRTAAERSLRESSALLEAFFRHTPTPLAFMDRGFNFIRVNEAYARAGGFTPEELSGRNHFELYPHQENQRIFRRAVHTGKPYQAFVRPFVHPRNPERGVTYWNWALTPLLDEKERVWSLVFNMEEVTERKRAEDELKRLNAALEQRAGQLRALAAELSDAEQRERRRLAEILHDDLQQMLAAVIMHADMLSGAVSGEQERESLEVIRRTMQEAIEITRSLSHDLSPPVLRRAGLGVALQWLAGQMKEKHGLRVSLQVSRAAEAAPERSRQFIFAAVRELLFNAVKHSGADSAAVRAVRSGANVKVVVEDRGRGFDTAALRTEGGLAGGFGLLNISERAALLGGSLTIDSSPGRGSRFVLVCPMLAAPAEQAARSAPRAAGDGKTRYRILLVDDHPAVRQALAALLSREPDVAEVGQASGGQKAIEAVRLKQPHVVFLDATVPEAHLGLARFIRRMWPHIRIFALTTGAREQTALRILAAEVERFLSKEGPVERLLAAFRSGAPQPGGTPPAGSAPAGRSAPAPEHEEPQ